MIRHSHMDKTLDDSVAWKKAVGRRREDNTRGKWWWWSWWRQWWWRWRWRGWMAMEMMMNDKLTRVKYHIYTVSRLFWPHRGFAPGPAPEWQSESKDMLFYTAKSLHREDVTHRSLYTERDLHRAAFTQTLLRTDAFAHRSICTEKPFLKKPYHMKPLHRAALHTDAFSQRSFYTQEL